ncbi:MAG: asparaginase domain-containing protein [Firmicutes bacterium]|nr:asparaginase domain-containing protein [Bacillota bacterium]
MKAPKKILLVLTGGTISCRSENGVRFLSRADAIRPYGTPEASHPLLDLYRLDGGDADKFVTVCPYCILSENLSLRHLEKLLSTVACELNKNIYYGVIIAHGTDTLEFTRSLCRFFSEAYHIPVPIEFAYAYAPYAPNPDGTPGFAWDGYRCFKAAVEAIERVRPTLIGADGIRPQPPDLSRCSDGLPSAPTGCCAAGKPGAGDSPSALRPPQSTYLSDDVFILKAFPGMDGSLRFDNRIKRILIEGYHSCTAPVDPVLELAKKYKCYVCSPEPFSDKYDTMLTLEKHGVVFLTGSTTDIYAQMLLGLV